MTMNPTGSKGSAQRPVKNKKNFNENWDKIFSNSNSSKKTKEETKDETGANSTTTS